jgi:Family of unknown function (DUF5701)
VKTLQAASALEAEFERQLATLLRLGYPRIAGLVDNELASLVRPLRASLPDLDPVSAGGTLPFVVVLDRRLISAEQAMPLVEWDGRTGLVDMNPVRPDDFAPIDEVALPDSRAYLVVDVDTGEDLQNVTPTDALLSIKESGRSPLTIEEGVALLTHHPGLLRSSTAFSLLGSRRADKRVPALWTSRGRPRLGWCWAGNPHTWLGSASCVLRLGASGGT